MPKITDIILDFDGTCTQIPLIYDKFLSDYLTGINAVLTAAQQISDADWKKANDLVKKNSPAAGWTVMTTPSAPAAADPYIRSAEAARYLFTTRSIRTPVPLSAFTNAYNGNPAPWRIETLDVLKALIAKGVAVHLVTNSDTQAVTHRLQDLWGGTLIPAGTVIGNAAKYNINEPDWFTLSSLPSQLTKKYSKVPAVEPVHQLKHAAKIGRPLYLRRGNFFSVIAAIFKDDPARLNTSLFCGDVWELDLALPSAMGAHIHLIERAAPFNTYDYERELTLKAGGKISGDLKGLLDWIK